MRDCVEDGLGGSKTMVGMSSQPVQGRGERESNWGIVMVDCNARGTRDGSIEDGDEIGAMFRELACQAFPLGSDTKTRCKSPQAQH